MLNDDSVTYLGRVKFRSDRRLFGIRRADRRHHVYMIGRTGTGKTTLLKTMGYQDIVNGEGLALFDPHGDLAESLVSLVPKERRTDLIYLNLPDRSHVWHFNPLAGVSAENRSLAAAGIVEVFKKLWSEDWGPRLEHLLRNTVFTLLEVPGSSFGDIPRLLADKEWRKDIVPRVSNEAVRSFWETEYKRYTFGIRAMVTAPLLNKVGAFLTDPLLNRVLTGGRSTFDLREIMDQGKILLVNLAKGRIGEGPAALLGSLLVSSLSLAGLARANQPEDSRRDFFVYLDEFHTFATLSLATMLTELRKYRVGLVLAHQYLRQLQPEVRDAVLGNVGTPICLRVGAPDASLLAREFLPTFKVEDLVTLPNYSVYLRLMVNGAPSQPFSAVTLETSAIQHPDLKG